ncbi:MAG: lysophospholipase [Deltaproteobacteria bacterium]|nr:lysophospholipase [Deltaproteobacteria bacterium]
MRKRWIILGACLLIGLVLVFVYQRFNSAVPRFHDSAGIAADSERGSAHWYRKSAFTRLRGVALIVHGLNLKPERMEFLIERLNRAGIEALNLSLYGHGDNYLQAEGRNREEARLDSFRTVTYRLWSDEVYGAYQKAKRRARQKRVPLFLVGYSLGGLLGCELQVSRPDVSFDRVALFSPALKITLKPYLLKVLMPFPDLVLDSLSPEAYRANAGTPMAGYKALFEALSLFEENRNTKLNVPTVVFLDREDEFISYDDLVQMIAADHLDRWRVVDVQKDPPEAALYAHHLLIDETVVGRVMWSKMQAALLSHLVGDGTRGSRSRKK